MKAKEIKAIHLMVGDWVNAVRIGDKENYLESIRLESEQISEGYSFLAVPLTEDILKVNGFEEVGEYYIHRVDNNPNHYDFKLKIGGAIQREGFSLQCGIYIITIKYVHQLQHILRDCGLDKLADNFKIKEN